MDGVGNRLFQTSRGNPQQKAKSCGFAAVGFWLSCGPQSQLPVEGTGLGGTVRPPQPTSGPRQSEPQGFRQPSPPRDPAPGVHAHKVCWGAAAATAVLDGGAAERRVSPFFSSLLLKSFLPHKALSHTWFFQFLLHKTQHNNKIKRGYGEQWVQQINGQAQPSSAFIAISSEEHSLPRSLWNEPQQSLDLAGSYRQTRTFLSQLNPEDSSSGPAHVNLIIIIKVLLAQQYKLGAQCINLVKITERSQVMARARESFFISLSLKGGGGRGEARRYLSSAESSQKGFPISPLTPQKPPTTSWRHLKSTVLQPNSSAETPSPKRQHDSVLLWHIQKEEGKKKKITMSRKVGKVTLSRQGLLFSP